MRKRGRIPAHDGARRRITTAEVKAQIQAAKAAGRTVIKPQDGPQEKFLSSPADIVIYGGAAGGGKTYGALIEPLRHVHNKDFEAVIFRRTRPQIKQAGGLLIESSKIYPGLGASVNLSELVWRFSSGMRVRFAQLQHEKSKFEWQGAQIALAIFDELTHFSEGQFFYIVSRMRSTCGVRPYIRATCNPDVDSWVAEFIAWWIDQDETSPTYGLPIPERSGVVRWFVRDGDDLLWADSPDELRTQVPHWAEAQFKPKSLTFVAATVYDNQKLLEADPDYLSNLMALPKVEREQLLGGNWKIRPAAGLFFKEHYFAIIQAVPAGCTSVRWWDLAATKEKDRPGGVKADGDKEKSGPAWTVGLKLSKTPDNRYVVEDVVRLRGTPAEVETAIKNTASQDGKRIKIGLPQDPGQAGKFQSNYYVRAMPGYDIRAIPETGDKQTRAKPASAQAEAGNIDVLAGAWNKAFLREVASFPEGAFKDQVDALANAFMMLTDSKSKKMHSH